MPTGMGTVPNQSRRLRRAVNVACGIGLRIMRWSNLWVGFHAFSLCIAALLILVWGYSYRDPDRHDFQGLNDWKAELMYTVFRGDCVAVSFPIPTTMRPGWRWEWSYCGLSPSADFKYAVPLWPLILFSIAWGVYPFIPQYQRWRLYGQGRCSKCGYLLKGLRDPRCPECGQPFDQHDPSPDR